MPVFSASRSLWEFSRNYKCTHTPACPLSAYVFILDLSPGDPVIKRLCSAKFAAVNHALQRASFHTFNLKSSACVWSGRNRVLDSQFELRAAWHRLRLWECVLDHEYRLRKECCINAMLKGAMLLRVFGLDAASCQRGGKYAVRLF